MTTDDEFERRLLDYLEPGPTELADGVLWAARAQLPTTRRRSARLAWLAPWRDITMNSSTRLLLAGGGALAAVILIAGVVGPIVSRRDPGPGSTAAPSNGPSVSAPPSASVPPRSTPPSPSPSPTFTPFVVDRIDAADVAPAWTVTAASLWTPALAPDGRIWVPSNDGDQIRIYDETGKLAEKWGTSGVGDSQFKFGAGGSVPNGAGVAFAPNGSFYVLDSGNFRVQQFTADRQFVKAFGSYGSEPGQFASAVAIGLDDGGNLYVSDQGRHDVQVFTTSGTYVRTVAQGAAGYGLWGSGPGWFITTRRTDNGPGAIEYHSDGTIQGGWDLRSWNCEPTGVTRDQAPRNIYLMCAAHDGGIGYLLRFDESGTLLNAWRIDGTGIAVSPDGDAAFIVSADGTSLARYDLDPPPGG